jgi:predicted DNA-binding transcriptional regulator AlpA
MNNSNHPNLPLSGFVRIRQIIGDSKANPPILPIIPIGRSSWWKGVKEGKYPAPIKLGAKTTVWRAEDIHALLNQLNTSYEEVQNEC